MSELQSLSKPNHLYSLNSTARTATLESIGSRLPGTSTATSLSVSHRRKMFAEM